MEHRTAPARRNDVCADWRRGLRLDHRWWRQSAYGVEQAGEDARQGQCEKPQASVEARDAQSGPGAAFVDARSRRWTAEHAGRSEASRLCLWYLGQSLRVRSRHRENDLAEALGL